MKKCRTCVVLALAFLGSGAALLADPPPRDLHQESDGHWTPWSPPTEFPTGADVRVIQAGDTLWDLAAASLGDPYLWPQLWEQNQYIQDAHWIYPGDPLLMSLSVTSAQETLEQAGLGEGESVGPGDEAMGLDVSANPPVPLGTENDIYCTGYIGEAGQDFPFHLAASEHDALNPSLEGRSQETAKVGRWGRVDSARYNLTIGDVVYLDSGSDRGLSVGQILTSVDERVEVRHPTDDRVLGTYYQYTGRIRVLSVQESTAIAEIVFACHPIVVGTGLIPFEAEPVPLARRTEMRPLNLPARTESLEEAPVILMSREGAYNLGQDHVVFISTEDAVEVSPGDLMTIYRLNDVGLPPLVVGELGVLSVNEGFALAKILESRYSIFVGDRLELK